MWAGGKWQKKTGISLQLNKAGIFPKITLEKTGSPSFKNTLITSYQGPLLVYQAIISPLGAFLLNFLAKTTQIYSFLPIKTPPSRNKSGKFVEVQPA